MTQNRMEGRVVKEVDLHGRKVVFRHPRERDLDDFIAMHATLTSEKVMCSRLTYTRETGLAKIQEMLRLLEAGRRSDILIIVDEKVSGYGYAQPSGFKYCTVGLAMVSAVRGLGIGTVLMQLLEIEARKLGAERLYLDVWSANPAAIHVYENVGYRETGRRPGWVRLDSGDEADLIEMVKSLRP